MGPAMTMRGPSRMPGGDFLPPLLQYIEFAAHVTHAGHAVGNEQRQRDLLTMREPISEHGVDVHVPKAGDEKLSRAIDAERAFLRTL